VGRREITLSLVLLAALGAAVYVVVETTRTGDGAAGDGTRANDAATVAARDGFAPETAGSAEADPADRASNGRTRADEASRTAEVPLEVEFPGLVMLRSTALDVPPEVGTIVIRNADPAAPPLRLELPVKDGRFQGRGPFGAVVEVERLVLSGRELAFEHRNWDLARRWIEVEASWTPPTLVHVVDAVDGMELKSVFLRSTARDDGEREGERRSGGPCRNFSVSSKGPGGGSDSPLVLVAGPTTVVLHVAGYGDESVEIGGDARERRVEMKRPASIHVVASPWPGEPIRNWRGGSRPLRIAAIARVDAATFPSADRARSLGARAGLAAKRAAAAAWRARAAQARDATLQRVARLDKQGEALFEDLPGGTYLVWLSGDDSATRSDRAFRSVSLSGSVLSNVVGQDPSQPMVDVTTRPGERCEVTLANRSFAEPPATIRVQAVDALDRQPIALADDEVFVIPCEFADSLEGEWQRRSNSAVAAGVSESGVLDYEAAAGAYVLSVNPRHHLASRAWSDFIDVQPGDNVITVALPRAQGVVVEIDVSGELTRSWVDEFERVLPRLQCGGETLPPEAFWRETDASPRRLVHRYAPLAAGKYELAVPDGAGWDRSGTFPLEVRENEVTTIELRLTPPAEPDSGH
jgi:hypothetical protein